eukprot:SAG25_NODE_458_length_7855_cov_911.815111_3_plen_134_part_00
MSVAETERADSVVEKAWRLALAVAADGSLGPAAAAEAETEAEGKRAGPATQMGPPPPPSTQLALVEVSQVSEATAVWLRRRALRSPATVSQSAFASACQLLIGCRHPRASITPPCVVDRGVCGSSSGGIHTRR